MAISEKKNRERELVSSGWGRIGANAVLSLAFEQVSLVQLCARFSDGKIHIWLLHIARIQYRVPEPLAALLLDPTIVKAGRNVGGDLKHLCRTNRLRGYEAVFELGKNARQRGLVDNGYVLGTACRSASCGCSPIFLVWHARLWFGSAVLRPAVVVKSVYLDAVSLRK
jgi:hypothetical protein